MRSSWDEVEKLFINHWRQMSTPLHLMFVGKGVPLSVNASAVIGESAPAVLGSKFLILRGKDFECFVASDVVTTVEYSEPDDTRPAGREKYACFIEFGCKEGSTLVLGELLVDKNSAPR